MPETPPVCNAAIHKHVEFWHMLISANTDDYQGTQAPIVDNMVKLHLTAFDNCIAKMEIGCLRHPEGSTIGSQLLEGDCSHGWQILGTQP